MLTAILGLLNIIPGVSTVVSSIVANIFNAKVAMYVAKTGADQAVAVAAVQAAVAEQQARASTLNAITASKVLSFIVLGFALPLMIFYGKCVLWDTVLGWGSTNALQGEIASWSNTIIGFIFGSSTVLALGQMWFSRKT